MKMESWTVKGSVSVVFAFYFLLFFFNYYKEQKGLEYTKSRIIRDNLLDGL